MGRRQKQVRPQWAARSCCRRPVQAQSSGASIVDEALKGVQEDQARDAERVRRMVDEAVKGTERRRPGRRPSTRRTGRAAAPARGRQAPFRRAIGPTI